MDLKKCPCGKVPTNIVVTSPETGPSPMIAHVAGNCCEAWKIQYHNGWTALGTLPSVDRATRAWNDAPRGETP